ncbi:hypothetical protein AK812_SmicGene21079 [Symbiodinium microadriaticum]|uniref:Uncharacterized protein n=1 Tax=Symbiodinium microadriaticum TaxID=2951 RepID=A0A1Q9DNB6_SYMMI|nr:hypothetical protein AK812_SmicGene21079 [Symbiodinium microadriaticum]
MKNVACQPPVGQALRSVGCLPAAIISKPVADMSAMTSAAQNLSCLPTCADVRHHWEIKVPRSVPPYVLAVRDVLECGGL